MILAPGDPGVLDGPHIVARKVALFVVPEHCCAVRRGALSASWLAPD